MNHTLKIIFGKEQVNKYYINEPLNKDELSLNYKIYHFETPQELDSFCKGLSEAVGWQEYCVVTEENMEASPKFYEVSN